MLQEHDQRIAEGRDNTGSIAANSKLHARKRARFHLDSDDDSDGNNGEVTLGGFTHKGRALDLDQEDDFKDRIEHSSDEE